MEREELIKKYNIDLDKLECEQVKLAKDLNIKDKIDFSLADKFGAVNNTFIGNKILCCFIVCDNNYEIIDRAYVFDRVKFPYIPGFRAYRELPSMVEAYNKLNERPDIVFIPGQGITHPRLGLASHFSIATGVPSIGVSDSFINCEVENGDIIKMKGRVGKILVSKKGSRAMNISPGNLISIKSAYDLSKRLINLPHKLPEPMHLAGRYSREVRKELSV